jgi:hypothetical protein
MIQQPIYANDAHGYYKPCAQEELTVDDTVRSPTPPQGTRMARVMFRVDTVRLTLDGSDPVGGSDGIPIYDGYEEFYSIFELQAMKLVREGANDGTVYFIYYR